MVTVTRARDTDGISRLLRLCTEISRELLPFPIPVGILYLCCHRLKNDIALLLELKVNKAPGPDSIHSYVLKAWLTHFMYL